MHTRTRTSFRPRAWLLAVAGIAALGTINCTNSTLIGTSKDEARLSGGRDADGNDLCEALDWYGDGTCDDFCPQADPDCGTPNRSCGGFTAEPQTCAASEYCHYQLADSCGAADAAGECRTRPEACDDVYNPVCGCDGQTYANGCEANAAGFSVASAGACETPPGKSCGGLTPTGSPGCGTGEYCHYEPVDICGAADAPGVCKPLPEACATIYDPVCGCDGQTYGNGCDANSQGISVASPGECETPPGKSCGGLTPTGSPGCAQGEYCHYQPADICGAADAPGICRPLPEACDAVYDPVCACDGQTYGNACEANAAGTSVSSKGSCGTLGQSCGGFTPTPNSCSDGEFCNYAPEDICGAADAPGTCATLPTSCDDVLAPVCGCDGQTYDNACEANAAGTSVSFDGACQ